MKAVLRATVVPRIGQRTDHFRVLHNRARPAVEQQQRPRVGLFGTLVDEVNVHAINGGFELIELVQPSLLSTPVVLVAPIVDQRF